MQTVIALAGFAVLSSAYVRRVYRSKEKWSFGDLIANESLSMCPKPAPNDCTYWQDRPHLSLWLNSVSEFHKTQCYYSIALQLASFVALWGRGSVNRNQDDELFLLLIGADGLVPVALTLYTLALHRRADSYHVVLAVLSALLASITGFAAVVIFPSTTVLTGGQWPEVCGGRTPQGVCGQTQDFKSAYYPNRWFIAIAFLCDLLILVIMALYISTRVADPRRFMRARHFLHRFKSLRALTNGFLHGCATLISIGCTIVELFFFVRLFESKNVLDLHEWSFGQIVGITIWIAVIVDFVRHELGMSELSLTYFSSAAFSY